MKHSSELLVQAEPSVVIDVLADLATYPSWNDLVSNAEPTEAVDDDAGPAWRTTLRAQVGPFSRSKQLRFVRDELTSSSVRFVRHEVDGREHAQWMMQADVESAAGDQSTSTGADGSAAAVTLTLSYDGALWIPALGGVLSSAIERSTDRLPAYVEQR